VALPPPLRSPGPLERRGSRFVPFMNVRESVSGASSMAPCLPVAGHSVARPLPWNPDPPWTSAMRAAKRKRPLRRERTLPVPGVDLAVLAARVRYEGSAEHKTYPSPAGPPRLRSDATPCPPDLKDPHVLTGWLRDAIASGQVGAPWDHDFPQYAWIRRGSRCFEARLSNRELGTYHGYPLRPDEVPQWL
jgi:hypothetical protein